VEGEPQGNPPLLVNRPTWEKSVETPGLVGNLWVNLTVIPRGGGSVFVYGRCCMVSGGIGRRGVRIQIRVPFQKSTLCPPTALCFLLSTLCCWISSRCFIQARKCVACLNGILWSEDIRKERKLNIYNALIKSSFYCMVPKHGD
jgi:hypothetical protein